jgi:hypothetical protein
MAAPPLSLTGLHCFCLTPLMLLQEGRRRVPSQWTRPWLNSTNVVAIADPIFSKCASRQSISLRSSASHKMHSFILLHLHFDYLLLRALKAHRTARGPQNETTTSGWLFQN